MNDYERAKRNHPSQWNRDKQTFQDIVDNYPTTYTPQPGDHTRLYVSTHQGDTVLRVADYAIHLNPAATSHLIRELTNAQEQQKKTA